MADRWPDRALGEPVVDHEPDPAALDELMRAFAGDDPVPPPGEIHLVPDVADEAAGQPGGAIADDPRVQDADPAAADVDPAGGDDDVAAESSPPPKLIRIDDYTGGSVATDGEIDAPSEPAPTAASVPAQSPVDDGERVVITIDDELPDAVYIQGSLDGSRKESVVFIEDDDTGDAMVPESERDLRRGIEPRMRERRLAVRRAQGRKRLKWVVVAVLVVLLAVAALAVLGSGLFAVREDQVFVTGNVYTDEARLAEIVDDLVGTPVLLVDTQELEREIEAIPWVDEALVRTGFPHSVSIEILEREAWSTYQGPDGRFRVLDPDGRVLDVLDGYPIAYVLLTGPDAVDLEPGDFAPRGYAAASEFAKNLTGSIRGQIEMIEVAADGSRLVLWLDDGTEVRFGEARDLIVKLVRLETVLATEEGREPGVIDVSTREVTLPGES